MSKLLKYELRKTSFVKVFFLLFTGLFEIVYLLSLIDNFRSEPLFLTAGVGLSMTAIFACLICGLRSIDLLYRELNSKQSYMLFMTPRSSYQILGAKVLENGLSLLMVWAFYMVLGALDLFLALVRKGVRFDIETMMQFRFGFADVTMMAKIMTIYLIAWFSVITAAYLAIIVQATLLNGRRGSMLISLLIFMGILILFVGIGNCLIKQLSPVADFALIQSIYSLICAVLFYLSGGYLMEKKLSV